MNGVKILHVADCHIGASRSFLQGENVCGNTEIKDTFRKIIEVCKKDAIAFLLISGDLFETPFPDQEDVIEICHLFSQIPDTIVAIAAGNQMLLSSVPLPNIMTLKTKMSACSAQGSPTDLKPCPCSPLSIHVTVT